MAGLMPNKSSTRPCKPYLKSKNRMQKLSQFKRFAEILMKANVFLSSNIDTRHNPFKKFVSNKSQYVMTVHNGNGKRMETLVKIPLYQSVNAVNIADGAGNSVSYQ
uniref:Uncharacterized protein n=1 Tax=Acrobeloides nanus TaxID=290746 RepID=A0A914DBH5_9BILA